MTSLLVLAPAIISAITGVQSKSAVKDTALETGLPNAIQQIYVDTESCPYGTKCYVDEGSVGAVRCLGWDINVDRKGYFYEPTSSTA